MRWVARIPGPMRAAFVWIALGAFVAAEILFESSVVRYVFYAGLALYLLLLAVRAFRNRKLILFRFAPGTAEALGADAALAADGLRTRLDERVAGNELGFLKVFAREFRRVDRSARREPTWVDGVLDFFDLALPFQNTLVGLVSKSLKEASGHRSFRVSMSRTDDGHYLAHATSQIERAADIHVSRPALDACLDELAGRMYYELDARDLTPSYAAYACHIDALRLGSRVYADPLSDDADYEPAAELFEQALARDPRFVLAALYLAAMHSIRRSRSEYFDRSRARLLEVVTLCEQPGAPGTRAQRARYKGLALALRCNLTSQRLHRIATVGDEVAARRRAAGNQARARQALVLLDRSPLALHECAFALHSLDELAFEHPRPERQIVADYSEALDLYTAAIRRAHASGFDDAASRSQGNRAYLMIWSGALLRRSDGHIAVRMLGWRRWTRRAAGAESWRRTESDLLALIQWKAERTRDYSVANLCHLYGMQGEAGRVLACGLLLCDRTREPVVDGGRLAPVPAHDLARLDPACMTYLEGANDLASSMLAVLLLGGVDAPYRDAWRACALAFHARCLALTRGNEADHPDTLRIRTLKQMVNVAKLLWVADPDSGGPAARAAAVLKASVRRHAEAPTVDDLTERWMADLRGVCD